LDLTPPTGSPTTHRLVLYVGPVRGFAGCSLPSLTLLEEKLLARTRACVTVIKLLPYADGTTGDWAIRGHAVTVPHQGPEALVRALPNIAAALDVQVIFMGPATDLSRARNDPSRRARIERIFSVDWARVATWLVALKAINPLYHDIEINEAAAGLLADLVGHLLSAIQCACDATLEAEATVGQPESSVFDEAPEPAMESLMMAEGEILSWVTMGALYGCVRVIIVRTWL